MPFQKPPFQNPIGPRPARRPHDVDSPFGARSDPYYWLRDDTRTNPEILAHLAAENAYKDSVLEPVRGLIARVNEEIVARIPKDDDSVPVLHRGYWYWTRVRGDVEHPVYLRAGAQTFDGSLRAAQAAVIGVAVEVVLDCNALAAGSDYFELGSLEVSPDNRYVAYTDDLVGRRQYRLKVRDLTTQSALADTVTGIDPGLAWTADSASLLYIEQDPETLLGVRVHRHPLGASGGDTLIYEEPDDTFSLSVSHSKSERLIFIGSESTLESEWRYAFADDPALEFRVVLPRQREHEYQVEHHVGSLGERLIVRTNSNAPNFRVAAAALAHPGDRDSWQEIVAHDPNVFIHEFDVFAGFLAIGERSGGLRRIRIHPWAGREFHLVANEPAYAFYIDSNPSIDSTLLRYSQLSLVAPARTFEYDSVTGTTRLLKQEPVPGEFSADDYVSEFLWAPVRDGVRVPVSLVRRRDTPVDGSAPLCLYGYGAYGLSMDPAFSAARLSLLDRGFVYAIAHVRGGQELGRAWYDAGRLLQKRHTFEDFIDVTDFLVEHRYADRNKVFASGGSAGGLLVAAAINMAPEKYLGVCVHVPFVDVVTTMLDESLPLTTLEYDEWGNPNESRFYRYMLSYSPYDNIGQHAYPAVLATTGLWDSQVQYFEPAKWVARLRDANRGERPILLHVNLQAGHGGVSGRFRRYAEVAEEYGFMIELAAQPT